jgi:hypothetical protein
MQTRSSHTKAHCRYCVVRLPILIVDRRERRCVAVIPASVTMAKSMTRQQSTTSMHERWIGERHRAVVERSLLGPQHTADVQ